MDSNAILASSTSTIVPSDICDHLTHRNRFIVAHPVSSSLHDQVIPKSVHCSCESYVTANCKSSRAMLLPEKTICAKQLSRAQVVCQRISSFLIITYLKFRFSRYYFLIKCNIRPYLIFKFYFHLALVLLCLRLNRSKASVLFSISDESAILCTLGRTRSVSLGWRRPIAADDSLNEENRSSTSNR